jgi:hypothetical protein
MTDHLTFGLRKRTSSICSTKSRKTKKNVPWGRSSQISDTMNIRHNFVLLEVAFEDDQYADIARRIAGGWHDKFCREVAYIHKVLQ